MPARTLVTIWEILNGRTIVLSCHTRTRTLVAWNGSLLLQWFEETDRDGIFREVDIRTMSEAPRSVEAAGKRAAAIEEDELNEGGQ